MAGGSGIAAPGETTAAPARSTGREPRSTGRSGKAVGQSQGFPERRIELRPQDWHRATWRRTSGALRPLNRPAAQPFDRAAALVRTGQVGGGDYFSGLNWSKARIRLSMTGEEARFWLRAMQATLQEGRERMPDRLEKASLDGPTTADEVFGQLRAMHGNLPREVWLPLLALFPPAEVVDRMLDWDESGRGTAWHHRWTVLNRRDGFRDLVCPYLTDTEWAAVRGVVERRFDLSGWPASPYDSPPLPLLLAPYLGFHDALRSLVAGWAPGSVTPEWCVDAILGLGDPGLVEQEMRRLGFRPIEPGAARAWLAHTEYAGVGWLLECILAQKRKPVADALVRVLALVRAPETAAPMVEIVLRSRAPEGARQWLEKNPAHAAAGLVPLAAGRGRAAEAALDFLRAMLRKDRSAEVEAALERCGGPESERVRAALSRGVRSDPHSQEEEAPGWLQVALSGLDERTRPAWVDPGELPPIRVEARTLGEEHTARLLIALRESTLDSPHPLVAALRTHADALALDGFAWRLCELWQQHGRRGKESWALASAGLLGGDGCAMKLGPLARTFREQLQHQNAALALECLRAIGSDMALLQLRSFTRIPRDWSLKAVASGYLEELARRRGLTMDELEDRMVPGCGLDPQGGRTFSLGPRRFEFVLGPDLKPVLRGEDGRLRPDLPKPGAKDDAAAADASVAAWKLLKKQLAETVKLQAARLERAMVHRSRWSPADWQTLFARHPLMSHLARRLVWAGYDRAGGLRTTTFRLAEDGTLADPDDATCLLDPAIAEIGVPHPLELPPELLASWGERLSDYEIVSPFPQLGRPVYSLTPDEAAGLETARFGGVDCLAVGLAENLERRGWTRGDAGDGGCFSLHRRPFPSAAGGSVTAVVQYFPGICVWDLLGSPAQRIERCYFVRGTAARPVGEPIPLREIDPIALSEAFADLAAQTARR